MLLIGLTSLLIAIPLYSSTITPTLLTRITSIILLFSAALSFNSLYMQAIGSGLGLYSGLFHVTTVTQFMEIFLYIIGAFILQGYASEKYKDAKNDTLTPKIAEYSLIILFTTIGASFLISSADLVSMYLSIELQSFAVYILAAIYRNSESATSAGLKYFLLGALSSALILLGSSLIYAYTGLTQFENIYMITSVFSSTTEGLIIPGNLNESTVILGILIIAVGFLFKVAAAPFHSWAPDVYDGVPTIVTTWLTVMPKISIFIFLLQLQVTLVTVPGVIEQIFLLSFSENQINFNLWKNLLLTTSLLSLVIGTIVGLAQYRLKRLLAFSTISHVGFLLLALSVNSEEAITSFLFYLMQYSVTNLNTFFVILAFGYLVIARFPFSAKLKTSMEKNQLSSLSFETKKTSDLSYISQLKGQFYANPILGLSLAVCLFSMAGIPPLMGFLAKYMVLYSAIENGYYFLALVGILASVISAAYYLRIIRVIHFDNDSVVLNEKSEVFNDLRSLKNRDENVASLKVFNDLRSLKSSSFTVPLTSVHSYIIAVLTLFILLFLLSPSLLLNSSNLLALSLFTA